MKFTSIRLKVIILVIAMAIPIVLLGIAGTFYYQSIIKQNVWDNELSMAKTIAFMTPEYMNASQLYLKSIADRPLVIKAMEDNDTAFLHSMAVYTNETNWVNNVYFTDNKGNVIASTQNISHMSDSNVNDKPYVNDVLRTGDPVIGDAEPGYDQMPVVPIGLPIKDEKGTTLGELVGMVDLNEYSKVIRETNVNDQRIVYLVNRTGHIMIHNNPQYVKTMANFSAVPLVQYILRGESGVNDYYNPIENESRLGAYAPIEPMGWGVVVTLPTAIAYQPVWSATYLFAGVTALLTLGAILLGLYIGNGIVNPILRLSSATKMIASNSDYSGLLPLEKNDEIGELAHSFKDMAGDIQSKHEELEVQAEELESQNEEIRKNNEDLEMEILERKRIEEHLKEARDQAELYLDLMGHDISNMHQIVLGQLELAQEIIAEDGMLGAGQKECIDVSIATLERSAGLIDNVRKLQKLRAGEYHMANIDLGKLLTNVIEENSHIPGRNIIINYTPPEGYFTRANPLLKDVFMNLIGNAIKHSNGQTVISVSINTTDGCPAFYRVTIEDNGPGIQDEKKGEVFHRFKRGQTKARGTGLGLYIVKTLVESYNGNVYVEDRIPGDHTKGARFVVLLPVVGK